MQLSAVPDLPAVLLARFERVAARLAEIDTRGCAIPAGAARVCVCSEFLLRVLERFPVDLCARLADLEPLTAAAAAARFDLTGLSETEAMARLRQRRQVELARIAWRDLLGIAELDTTLAELSALADAAVAAACSHAADLLEPRFGRPRDRDGRELPLLVLAMGKLGGKELNFSSDVDLVFLYPDAALDGRGGDDADAAPTPAETYYVRVAQLLIKLLDQPTEDGIVYRVDTRLRPFGGSGPLVVSLGAFEVYLLQHGREWERYAYVKARLLTGAEFAADLFAPILTPFVYRRYLDYGVFDALRQMKRLIEREVARKDMAGNIKLGPGGIREIEFIVQAFQLVRGGQRSALRERSLLRVLPLLAGDRQLSASTTAELENAYRFLRILENRLQALEDRQTHDLPADSESRARLAYALRADGWDDLVERLRRVRALVEREFERIAWDVEGRDRGRSADRLIAAWESGDLASALMEARLAADSTAAVALEELRHGGLYQRMDEVARQRLAAVMARTLELLARHASPEKALERALPVYRAVCRRSAYLALLNENPDALERLLNLVERSAWLARQIAEHPLLLDELLDTRAFEVAPSRAELTALFNRCIGAAQSDDPEALLDAIRVFQRTAIFRIAIADRLGSLPLMQVSDRLTDTAEIVLDFALRTAWRELTAKYGTPTYGAPREEAGFAVIGYGKLGGLELGYGSDLDLVFLHDSHGARQETTGTPPLDNDRFFARLVQRLIHYLTIQTTSGRLYEVDTRLRPSGRAGLLVTGLDGFFRYQTSDAWVWEHQALLRSRAVAGASAVCERFERLRREILVEHVDRSKLKSEIAKMRARMRAELSLAKQGGFDLKQDPGGIADIEFLVDYWVLSRSNDFPELVEFPDNVRQLEALARTGLVSAQRCGRLKEAYLALRARAHELALDERARVVGDDELTDVREFVLGVWNDVFGDSGPELGATSEAR